MTDNIWAVLNAELLRPILRPGAGHVALLAGVALAAIGLEAIDTAPTAGWMGRVALKQGLFLVAALAVCVAVALPHHRIVGQAAYPLAIVSLGLLVFLLIPGMPQWLVPVRNGARRWIDLQVFQFQPSELAKIAFVLAVARYLRYRENYRTLRGLAIPLAITFVPMALILVEPDLGTAMIFLPVLFAMLIAAGAQIRHLALVILLGLVMTPLMYPLLRPHQKDRVIAMAAQVTGDTRHRESTGFQGYKAITTAGAGQVTGYGKERAGVILRFNAVPEAHNDMIFAVICARWGLVGGAGVLVLYLLLMVSGLAVAGTNKDPFARLVAVGVVTVFFTQVFINIGMTIGLLPITGMTLPLVSYGGSSMLASFAMIGLLINVAARRPIMGRPSFEFD